MTQQLIKLPTGELGPTFLRIPPGTTKSQWAVIAQRVTTVGYGYQWWLAPEDDGAYCAIGVYNQYVYVNPRRRIVIAKASANRHFGASYDEAGYRDEEHLALFAAIAREV